MFAHWLLPVLVAAPAAWLIVLLAKAYRRETRYLHRLAERAERRTENTYWAVYRAQDAELARQLDIARRRAESLRRGFHEATS